MRKNELAKKLSSNIATINQTLIALGREDLVEEKNIPDDLAQRFLDAATGTQEPTPEQQPAQPAPNLTHKPAESLAEQQTETREQARATELRIDEILASKAFQAGTIDANLQHLFYRQGYTQQSLENKLDFLSTTLAEIDHINAAKLDRANLYELAEKLGAKLPQQTYSDLCQLTHQTEQSSQLLEALGKLR